MRHETRKIHVGACALIRGTHEVAGGVFGSCLVVSWSRGSRRWTRSLASCTKSSTSGSRGVLLLVWLE